MSRFTDHLGLQDLEDANGDPIPTDDGRSQWTVLPPPLVFEVGAEGSGEKVTAPPGMPTDLGSIPRFAWVFGFSPDGKGAKAFVIHDAGYRSKGTFVFDGVCYRTRVEPYTRAEVDNMLRDALAACKVGVIRRNAIYQAVRIGGGRGWGS